MTPFSPELCEALHGDGVPLCELFRMQVGEDAELSELLLPVEGLIFDGEYCCEGTATLAGVLSPSHPNWPVSIRHFDLVSEWLDADGNILGMRLPDEKHGYFDRLDSDLYPGREYYRMLRAAETRLRTVYGELINQLQVGALVAAGHMRALDRWEPISRAIWSSDATRIAFCANEIRRFDRHVEIRRRGLPAWRVEDDHLDWTGVMVAWRADLNRPAPPQDLGGRPLVHDWPGAYDELVCMIAAEGMPGSWLKVDLARMLITAFERLGYPKPSEGQASAWLRHRNRKLWIMAKPAPE